MDKENTETKSTGRAGDGGSRSPNSQANSVAARSHEAAENIKDAAVERLQNVYASAESVKGQAAEHVRKLSSAVRKVGEHLRVEEQERLAGYAVDASQRIEDLASYIESAELSSVVRDTETFARRRSAVFFGGALVMGLAAGRFLRSSGAGVRDASVRRVAERENGGPNVALSQDQNVNSRAPDTFSRMGNPRRNGEASS